mgnify:FL=1
MFEKEPVPKEQLSLKEPVLNEQKGEKIARKRKIYETSSKRS